MILQMHRKYLYYLYNIAKKLLKKTEIRNIEWQLGSCCIFNTNSQFFGQFQDSKAHVLVEETTEHGSILRAALVKNFLLKLNRKTCLEFMAIFLYLPIFLSIFVRFLASNCASWEENGSVFESTILSHGLKAKLMRTWIKFRSSNPTYSCRSYLIIYLKFEFVF